MSLPGGDPTAKPTRDSGRIRASVHLAYENRTSAYRGSARIDNKLGEDTTITTLSPSISMGVLANVSVLLAIPIVHFDYQILEHQDRDGQALPDYQEDEFGLGDMTLACMWSPPLLATTEHHAWFGFGASVPTAEERDYPALRGAEFGEVLSLGSGTWDPLFMHGFGFKGLQLDWVGSVFFRWSAYENQFGYRAGSVVQSWFGASHRFDTTQTQLLLRLGYRHQWRARRDGVDVLNSGGDWVSIAPDFKWDVKPGIQLQVSVELPLWRDIYAAPNGVDQLVNGQTDADQRWQIGLVYELPN